MVNKSLSLQIPIPTAYTNKKYITLPENKFGGVIFQLIFAF